MKILFLTQGDETSAGSRTRVFQYVPHLERAGIRVRIIVYGVRSPRNSREIIGSAARASGHFVTILKSGMAMIRFCHAAAAVKRLLLLSLFADIVYIQKVLLHPFVIRLLKLFGRKLVFDFDDAIYLPSEIDRDKTTRSMIERMRRRFDFTVAQSDLVTLENDFTESCVRRLNSNTLKITGPIDTERYRPSAKLPGAPVVIGWIGSRSTTPYLARLVPVMRKLASAFPQLKFLFIGADKKLLGAFEESIVPWDLSTEAAELSSFDIGIMPLVDDEWTRGKGGYKLLQYMAMGIPSIASPVGINSELVVNDVNGFLADSDQEWFERSSSLIQNEEQRRSLGRNARKIAEEKYSFFVAAEQIIKALGRLKNKS